MTLKKTVNTVKPGQAYPQDSISAKSAFQGKLALRH